MTPPRPIHVILSRVVVQPDGCWLWQGKRMVPQRGGYGVVQYRNKEHRAHRFFYECLCRPCVLERARQTEARKRQAVDRGRVA